MLKPGLVGIGPQHQRRTYAWNPPGPKQARFGRFGTVGTPLMPNADLRGKALMGLKMPWQAS